MLKSTYGKNVASKVLVFAMLHRPHWKQHEDEYFLTQDIPQTHGVQRYVSNILVYILLLADKIYCKCAHKAKYFYWEHNSNVLSQSNVFGYATEMVIHTMD